MLDNKWIRNSFRNPFYPVSILPEKQKAVFLQLQSEFHSQKQLASPKVEELKPFYEFKITMLTQNKVNTF